MPKYCNHHRRYQQDNIQFTILWPVSSAYDCFFPGAFVLSPLIRLKTERGILPHKNGGLIDYEAKKKTTRFILCQYQYMYMFVYLSFAV